jgi:hypothetical protein
MDNTITARILESMSDGVLVTGFNGRIIFAAIVALLPGEFGVKMEKR